MIPTYNRAGLVVEAVQSALSQRWEPLEVVVVDDGSTDNTVVELQRLAAADPRLRVIARDTNGGESVARNLGIVAARNPYVALLDSDNRFMPEKLGRQMPLLLGAPDGAVCFSGYLLDRDESQEPVVIDAWQAAPEAALRALLVGCCVNTSTLIAPRELLIEAGLFRTDLRWCEDHDLWLRLAITGHPFLYEPAPLTLYRQHGGSVSADEASVARYSELVIGDFFKRYDLPAELLRARRSWLSRWALSGAERYIVAGRGREALSALTRAAALDPTAIRLGWALLALRALRLLRGSAG